MTALTPPLSRQVRSGIFKALRLVFRLTPMPTATRDRLRQRFLDTYQDVRPIGPRGQAPSADARVRRAYVRSDERAIGYVPYSKGELPDPLPATLIAFYLPQFHAIPENDEWWGKGFTEWRNVTRALPQFEGHAQPRLPGDLGFYDLRDPEVMREQARLAREYGIGAFCFYFYWFGGKTLLETPLRNWLADPTIDFPFCLCWANEKWSRTWDGRGDQILIDQRHSPEDDLAFIAYVADYLRDPRYLRVDGKPMLLLYRPGLLADAAATALRWRNWCRDNGIGEIHLAYVQSFDQPDPSSIQFDAAIGFPPNLSSPTNLTALQKLLNTRYAGEVLDWRTLACQPFNTPGYRFYPSVNPGWDNEARRPGKGRTFVHSSPRGYRDWLMRAIDVAGTTGADNGRLVFINAWNEWAEGAILEPDARLGHAYLQATRDALQLTQPAKPRPHAIIHAWHLEDMDELLGALLSSGLAWHLVITTTPDRRHAVEALLSVAGMTWEIETFENKGRDVLPFLKVADRLLASGVDVVLKLHTKRSEHRGDGDQWRKELVMRLVGGARSESILNAFALDRRLGIVGPEGHILPLHAHVGDNYAGLDYVATRTGLPEWTDADRFVAGSMFWARLEALRPLLDACLSDTDFDIEQGQVDGTLAHAVERCFGICARMAGFELQSAAVACGQHEPVPAIRYQYTSTY